MWQYLHELEQGMLKIEHSSEEKREKQKPEPKMRLYLKEENYSCTSEDRTETRYLLERWKLRIFIIILK